jgi:hypothetical protein
MALVSLEMPPPYIQAAMQVLRDKFKNKALGDLTYCLGIQNVPTSQGVFIHKQNTPPVSFVVLRHTLVAPPRYQPHAEPSPTASTTDDNQLSDHQLFMEALGCLNYAALNTRPDLVTALSYLGGFMAQPTVTHWKCLQQIYGNLKSTRDLGIFYAYTYTIRTDI